MKNFLRVTMLAICAIFMVANVSAQDNYNATTMGEKVYLETASWGQNSPFNKQIFTSYGGSTNAKAGCVPTAYAIVMRYHGFPEEGTTKTLYNCQAPTYVEITDRVYDFSKMPLTYNSDWTQEQIDEVSKFFSHVLHACFPSEIGTGATTVNEGQTSKVLNDYFNYQLINASYQANFTMEQWAEKLRESIDNGCPVPYAANNSGTGDSRHMFVVDGYTTEGYFHFNFGWSGSGNGWFKLDNITPSQGDNYSWNGNSQHYALFNLAPNKTPRTVTATANPSSMGTVSINGGTAGSSVSAEVIEGTKATLTAHPADGYALANWTKNGVIIGTKNPIQVTVGESGNDYVANFDEASNVQIEKTCTFKISDVTTSGISGSYCSTWTTGDGIVLSCTKDSEPAYALSTSVNTFFAKAAVGNSETLVSGITYTLTAPEGYVIKSYSFKGKSPSSSYTIDVTVGGNTTNVTNASAGVVISASDINAQSTSFILGSTYAGRAGLAILENGITVTIQSEGGSTPTPTTYTISVTAGEGGTATVNGNSSATVTESESVTLAATPAGNYIFTGWYNGAEKVSGNANYTFTPTESASYEARFVAKAVSNCNIPTDNTLRYYRFAIAIAQESYTRDFGSSYDNVKQFWQECEDFMNEVYVPLGMCFDVVIDQRLLLGTNLPVNNGLPEISGVTDLINNAIGSGSYDIGLCISYRDSSEENTGLSAVNGAYSSTTKANGYAQADKWVVAHEAGHLFGADHTTEGESSLMDNIGEFFSYPSIKKIRDASVSNGPSNAYKSEVVANNAPTFTAQMKNTYRIPKGACLSIPVYASDADGHSLRYAAIGCSSSTVGNITGGGTMPHFASLKPQTSNIIDYSPKFVAGGGDYYLPVDGTNIPSMSAGSYSIAILVNDMPEGNSYDYLNSNPFYSNYDVWDATVEIVDGTPFTASISPAQNSYTAGSNVTVTWGVNNSVFTEDSRVRITMSTDYGKTFSHVLADDVRALDGSKAVTLPNVNVGNVDVDFSTQYVSAVRSMRAGIIRVEVIDGAAYTLTTPSPENGGGFNITGGGAEPDPTPVTYAITTAANPAEGGTAKFSVGTGSQQTQGNVNSGELITLYAVANDGYKFVNWTLNGTEVSTEANCNVTASQAANYVANFEAEAAEPEQPEFDGTKEETSYTDANWFRNNKGTDIGYGTESWGYKVVTENEISTVTLMVKDKDNSGYYKNNLGFRNVNGVNHPFLFKGTTFTISVPEQHKITGYSMTVVGENFNTGTVTYTTGAQMARSNTSTATISGTNPTTLNATGLDTNSIEITLGSATDSTAGVTITNLDIYYKESEPEYTLGDRLTSNQLMSVTKPTHIAVKNLSKTNNWYFAGTTNVADFGNEAVFVWTPKNEGDAGEYYLKTLDGKYLGAAGDDTPISYTEDVASAAVFTTLKPVAGSTGTSKLDKDSDTDSYVDNYDLLVRFMTKYSGGTGDVTTWINVTNTTSPNHPKYYNGGYGMYTAHFVYAVSVDGVAPEIPDEQLPTDPLAGKFFRIKVKNTSNYMNIANTNNNTSSTSGVTVVAKNESSDTQIFLFEQSGDGYKLKANSGNYIKCHAWNANANTTSANDATVLTFETTGNELEYLIKWDNTNMNNGVERDDYFKAENGYVYCDAASNAASTWVLEEVIGKTLTVTFSGATWGNVSNGYYDYVTTNTDPVVTVRTANGGKAIGYSTINQVKHPYLLHNNNFTISVPALYKIVGYKLTYKGHDFGSNKTFTYTNGTESTATETITQNGVEKTLTVTGLENSEIAINVSDNSSKAGVIITALEITYIEDTDLETYTVTVTAGENGTATASAETVAEGDNVTLTATANTDYKFVGWYNGETKVSEANPYTFAVTSNISYEARFEELFPDGAYKVYWQADNRGYLAYHGTDYPNEAKLAGVTYSGCENLHYGINDADLVWYLITASDGKRYLFEVATGKFLGVDTSVQANGTGNKLSTSEAWAIAVEPNTNSTRLGHYIITTMISGTKNLLCSGCGTPKAEHPVRWLPVNDTNLKDGGAPLQLVPENDVTVADDIMNAVRAVIEPKTFQFKAEVENWRNDNPNTHLGTITIGGTPMKLTPEHLTASELTMPFGEGTTLAFTRKYRGFEFNGFYIGSTSLGENPTLTAEHVAAINETTPLVAKFTATDDVTLFYDDDEFSYRIPAIAKTGTNRLIAVSDYRHSHDDIGRDQHHTGTNRVDLVMRTSDDNGLTWSAKQTIAEGTSTFGYGDAAIVANGEDILVMAVAGNVFYPNANATNKNKTYRIYSNNNGQSWTKEEVTSNIFGLFDEAYATFFGSGKLAVDPNFNGTGKARVYGAILLKNSARSTNNYVLFSDDWGATWNILGGSKTQIAEADEPKVEILPNGQILLSSRHASGGSRVFNVFTYGNDKAAGEGTWGTAVSGCSNGGSNGTNGEIICLDAKQTNGKPTKILLQSQPQGGSNTWDRKDVTIWYKEIGNETQTPSSIASGWTKGLQVSTVQSAYSAMTLQENGKIAFFFEEAPCHNDDNTYGYSMVYVPLTIEEITNDNFLNPNADVEYVPTEFNIVLTDAQDNEYRETLDYIPENVAAVESYLTTTYPFITLGTTGVIADNKYTNSVTLPFKVSNANTTVWHNIYWPSYNPPSGKIGCPVYLSATDGEQYVPKVTADALYGASEYNTLDWADRLSWAVYSVNNSLTFKFKNKSADKYIQVTSVASGNAQNTVYADETNATVFTLLKDTGTRNGDYALAAKVGETAGYLCSTSAGYDWATHFEHTNHEGAWVVFKEEEVVSSINDLKTALNLFGEGKLHVITDEVQAIITALDNPNNIILNTLVQYGAVLDDAMTNWKTLTLTVNDAMGSVTINDEARKTKKAPSGFEFTVVATPASGYRFTHWSNGTTTVSSEASYTFNMPDAATGLTANFEEVSAAYPEVTGNTNANNYLTSVTTEGGRTNVNYSANTHPGEKVVTIGTVQIGRGESFSMNLIAYSLGDGSTSAVREDMRYCHASLFTDFDGDRTFGAAAQTWGTKSPSGTNPYAGGNSHVYGNYDLVMNITANITVPVDAPLGESHVRMIYTNAWKDWPTNGTTTLDKGIVYDIIVEVVEDVENVTITVGVANENTGTVTINGEGVDSKQVAKDSNVTVVATPASGYHFVNWTDAGGNAVSTDASYTFTASENTNLVANFEADVVYHTITVSKYYNNNGGTVKVGEEDATSVNVAEGESVRMLATVADGYEFMGWLKDGVIVKNAIDDGLDFEVQGPDYTLYEVKASAEYVAVFSKITETTGLEDGKAYRICGVQGNGRARCIYRDGNTLKWKYDYDNNDVNTIFVAQKNGNAMNLISAVGYHGWKASYMLGNDEQYNPYAAIKVTYGTRDELRTLYIESGTSSGLFQTNTDGAFSFQNSRGGGLTMIATDEATTDFLFEEVDTYAFQVSAADGSNAKLGTVNLPFATTVPAEVTVYGVNNSNEDYVYVTPLELTDNVLPANTPVLIEAETAGKYGFKPAPASANVYDTGFAGTLEAEEIPGTTNAYILSYKGVGTHIMLYKLSSTDRTINANKAYYIDETGKASSLRFVFGGTTDIEEVEREGLEDTISDLQGRKLSEITEPGMYIINGKKVYKK